MTESQDSLVRDPNLLLELQSKILKQVTLRHPLTEVLESLCKLLESMVDNSICSIMRYDALHGWLYIGTAPCLLPRDAQKFNGLIPGELAASCGTAYYTRKPVLVGDVRIDPRWENYRGIAEELGIRACWSIPIISTGDNPIGTFAISRTTIGTPTPQQFQMLETAGDLAGIAIDRDRDETQVQEQRALLKNVIEGSGDPIFAKDHTGHYILANSAEAERANVSLDAIIGMSETDLYPQELATVSEKIDDEVLQSGQSKQYEQEFCHADGEHQIFLVRKSALSIEGKPNGVIGVARDITSIRNAEEAMRHTQKLESLGILASGLAHDFNNLLTGTLANVGYALSCTPRDSNIYSCLEDIKFAATRGAELTQQLLAYAGKAKRQKQVVSLATIVEQETALLATSISKKSELQFDITDASSNIEADRSQIRQLVMNLIINASEAHGNEGGKVFVSIKTIPDTQRPLVVLEVRDTGCGMDEETRSKIFDPFFTTKFTGRGLGLAAVQGIVHSHGGTISVDSKIGEGTTFTVFLPNVQQPSPKSVSPQVEQAPTTIGTILVVDDDPCIRRTAKRILEQAKHTVVTASDGQEAIDVFANHRGIDAIVLDVSMPRMGGDEVFRKIVEIDPSANVILSSGHTQKQALQNFGSLKPLSVVLKPYLPEDLLSAVGSALEEKRDGSFI